MQGKAVDNHAERVLLISRAENEIRKEMNKKLDGNIDQSILIYSLLLLKMVYILNIASLIHLGTGRPCAERPNTSPTLDGQDAGQVSANAVDYTDMYKQQYLLLDNHLEFIAF